MGTNVFFTECDKPPKTDPNFRELPPKTYKYFTKSNKVLKMNRIFVEEVPKNKSETSERAQESEKKGNEDIEHLRVTKTYEEALNQFLRPGESAPRAIPIASNESTTNKPTDDVTNEDDHEDEGETMDEGNEDDLDPEMETLTQEIEDEMNELLSEDVE